MNSLPLLFLIPAYVIALVLALVGLLTPHWRDSQESILAGMSLHIGLFFAEQCKPWGPCSKLTFDTTKDVPGMPFGSAGAFDIGSKNNQAHTIVMSLTHGSYAAIICILLGMVAAVPAIVHWLRARGIPLSFSKSAIRTTLDEFDPASLRSGSGAGSPCAVNVFPVISGLAFLLACLLYAVETHAVFDQFSLFFRGWGYSFWCVCIAGLLAFSVGIVEFLPSANGRRALDAHSHSRGHPSSYGAAEF